MKTLSSNGYDVPVLGFGTWKLEGQDCVRAVQSALEIGYRHIDTAQIYENEMEVGTALSQSPTPREDIFLTTKIWMENVSADRMESSFKDSLFRLKTDYVDMLLLHWPVSDVPLKEQLDALMQIKKSGRARQIGVSNYTTALIHECLDLGAQIANNQVEYHPFLCQKTLLDYMRSKNMFLTAYSPLARGGVIGNPTIKAIANKYNKSESQIALRWLIQQDGVCAIPKASSDANIRSNFAIFDFALTLDEMNAIHNLATPNGRLINPEWAPHWDTPKQKAA